MFKSKLVIFGLLLTFSFSVANAQTATDDKANGVVAKAVQFLGGDRYLQIRTQVGRGKYSVIRDNMVASFQSFTDVIVFPDKERTEFKSGGSKSIQANIGKTGWMYDSDQESIKNQTTEQIENFSRGIRVSLDSILRGYWKGTAKMSYVGRRPASLGKRNDVVRLTYNDGFVIEFEFADDGTPAKAVYKHTNADGNEITEEDRFAQFIDVGGIKAPFIIDRYTNGAQNSRINYDTIEFNKTIPDAVFAKPASPKELKKDLKL